MVQLGQKIFIEVSRGTGLIRSLTVNFHMDWQVSDPGVTKEAVEEADEKYVPRSKLCSYVVSTNVALTR